MPFDGLTFGKTSIDTVLSSLGITPLPMELLESHKAKEVAKHPGSLFYRRPNLHMRLFFVSIFVTTVATEGGVLAADHHRMLCLALCGLGFASAGMMLYLTMFSKKVSPACWEEQRQTHLRKGRKNIPAPILALVEQVKAAAPDSVIVIGTLYQEKNLTRSLYLGRTGSCRCLHRHLGR